MDRDKDLTEYTIRVRPNGSVRIVDGNEERLLSAAKDAGQRTEARAYLGANLLARGERGRAVEILTKVLREDEPGYLEYDLAYYELERLGAATAADRRALKRSALTGPERPRRKD